MAEVTENKPKRSRSRSPVKVKEEKERRNESNDESRRSSGRRRSRHETEDSRFHAPSDRRVYVANLQYDTKWQDLKDLFREVVGDCEYVHLFDDENGKPRGCGIVEFKDKESVEKALDKMHKYAWKGRNIVVKEDHDVERDATGRIIRPNRSSSSSNRDWGRDWSRGDYRDNSRDSSRKGGNSNSGRHDHGFEGRGMDHSSEFSSPNIVGNTFGLSTQFLESLNIKGPLTNRIFVANLDFRVKERKLREVFQLAGHVVDAHLNVDRDGKSRGHGVLVFDHPLEAVQAISMLNGQMLLDRGMIVKMDRREEPQVIPRKLPSGLKNIGIGLGSDGKPLDIHGANPISNVNNGPPPATGFMRSGGNELFARGDNFGNEFPSGDRGGAGLLGDGAVAGNRSLSYYMGNGGGGGGGGGGDRPGPSGPNMGFSGGSSSRGMMPGQFDNCSMGQNFGNGRRVDSNMMIGSGGGGGMKVGGGNFGGGLGLLGHFGGEAGGGGGGGAPLGMAMGERGNDRFDEYRRDYGRREYSPARNNVVDDFRNPMDDRNRFQDGNPSTVFIHNLSHTCTPKILRDRFSDIGIVKYARISAQGVGIVCFSNDLEAERAITLFDGSRLDGRTIEVSYN